MSDAPEVLLKVPQAFRALRGSGDATKYAPTGVAVAEWHAFPHGTRLNVEVYRRDLEAGRVLLLAGNVPGLLAEGDDFDAALRAFVGVSSEIARIYREDHKPFPLGAVELEPDDVRVASVGVDV